MLERRPSCGWVWRATSGVTKGREGSTSTRDGNGDDSSRCRSCGGGQQPRWGHCGRPLLGKAERLRELGQHPVVAGEQAGVCFLSFLVILTESNEKQEPTKLLGLIDKRERGWDDNRERERARETEKGAVRICSLGFFLVPAVKTPRFFRAQPAHFSPGVHMPLSLSHSRNCNCCYVCLPRVSHLLTRPHISVLPSRQPHFTLPLLKFPCFSLKGGP